MCKFCLSASTLFITVTLQGPYNQREAVDDTNVRTDFYQGEPGFAVLSTAYDTNATSLPTNMT